VNFTAASNAENGIDLGIGRSDAGVLQINNGTAGGSAGFEMFEMTAPGNPAANGARVYAEDNGSGKTRIVAKFADGSTAVIATQP
jgi:hypothetical protein